MLKKSILPGLVLTMALSVFASVKTDITMLIVPRETIPVRIAQDFAQRYPVLLVTYRTDETQTVLNAWNGTSWVGVSTNDYISGAFFTVPPKHAILVQAEGSTVPDLLIPDGTWCAEGNRLASTDPRVMLHILGRYFDIPYGMWKDLTWRYSYPLEAINPGLVNIPWWHFRGKDVYKNRVKRDFSADLDKWYYLDIEPPAVDPIELKEELAEVPEVEIPAEEPAQQTVEPVKTEAPAAEKNESTLTPTDVQGPVTDVEETIETVTVEEPVPAAEITEADPFSDTEIPAAEIVEPAKKKSWWKIF
ncbi:MAG: hypothetical protein AB7E95_13200 [Kiritimatiellales bacterium]